MDDLDAAIVAALQQDARQSNRELARRLGVAPSTTLDRVRSLDRRGVLRVYHAEVSLPALGRTVQAMVSVQVRPLHRAVIDGFQTFVEGLPEVLSVFVLAGNDDFLLHVAVGDVERLHAFLVDRLSQRKEVAGFRTSVVYRHARSSVVSPLPSSRD